MVQQTSAAARILRRSFSAAATAVLLGSLVGPAAVSASATPTVPDVNVTTAQNVAATGNLLAGASGFGGTPTILSHNQFLGGFGYAAINNTTGAFTFTPTSNAYGTGSIYFNVSDGTDTVMAHLNVRVDALPACGSPSSSGNEDTPQGGTLSCPDADTSAASVTYALVGQAANGTAAVNSDGTWTYTPNANYNGPDSFTFKANDGLFDSAVATMSITVVAVNDPPVCASPVTSNGGPGAQQSGTFSCPDVDTLAADVTYALVDPASHGTAVVNADGSWTYTPSSPLFSGSDSFTFKANDGSADSNTATVNITVNADTTAPTVAMPAITLGSGRVDESAPITISWSATDGETGVKSYVVQQKVGTGAWTQIYSGTAKSITRFYPFSTALAWRVMATDNANNASGWVTTTSHSLVAYQEGSSAITRSGTWTYVASSGSSGTGYRYTTTYLRYAQLRFSGTQVLFVAPRVSSGGYYRVYVDGVYKGRFSNYRSATLLGQILYRATWGSSGTHTIKIVNAQSGKRTTLDAFIVLR